MTQPDSDDAAISTPPPLARGGAAIDGLYLHTPFCFHKCHYCDFYSLVDTPVSSHAAPISDTPTHNDRQAKFTDRLIQELELRCGQAPLRPRTVFVGGGTPTLLRPTLWSRLLGAMQRLGCLQQTHEFTVEANPETVTPQLMDRLAAGGVNRVSLGAQSFQPALLEALERWHEPGNVAQSVRLARAAGIHNINLDLIFAIPGQTMPLLEADLDAALALEPDHLSVYNLTYEPNTPLTARRAQGAIVPVAQDVERAMYQRIMDRLAQAGYEHYEISNWARPGRRCAHNILYWENQNWLGLGPGAASHINGYRWKNQPHLSRYTAQSPEPPTTDHELLPPQAGVGEQLMMRLRLREGVPQTWLAQNLPDHDARYSIIEESVRLGLLERTTAHLRLTHQGLFVADAVIGALL